jgi:hypothetical protein
MQFVQILVAGLEPREQTRLRMYNHSIDLMICDVIAYLVLFASSLLSLVGRSYGFEAAFRDIVLQEPWFLYVIIVVVFGIRSIFLRYEMDGRLWRRLNQSATPALDRYTRPLDNAFRCRCRSRWRRGQRG